MANEEQLAILKQGVKVWNNWRKENSNIKIDLFGAILGGMDLTGIKLFDANLNRANFKGATLNRANLNFASLMGAIFEDAFLIGSFMIEANLIGAKLINADLSFSHLSHIKLIKADLSKATLIRSELDYANLDKAIFDGATLKGTGFYRANLTETSFIQADLTDASLSEAHLINTILESTILSNCNIYGISAWDLTTDNSIQKNLVITKVGDSSLITVDNIEVAQFIYLLLNNQKIRHVVDTITSKVVLILGRFTPKRKAVLDTIRDELRKHDYLPILFDFDKLTTRDTEETITTLARLARFIIADMTDPKSIPQELTSIVPVLPSVPVQPILQNGYEPWGMFDHIKRYPWVLKIHQYNDWNDLNHSLEGQIIPCIETKVEEIYRELCIPHTCN